MLTTIDNRESSARAAYIAASGHTSADMVGSRILARVLVTIVCVGSACSRVANLDGLSKDYGKPDAAQVTGDASAEQPSDHADSTSSVRDGSIADDVTDRDAVVTEDAHSDLVADSLVDLGIDRVSSDTAPGNDADPTSDGGTQICESEEVAFGTLELSTTATVTSCGYSSADLPRYHAAVDSTTFGVADACGACVRIALSNAVVDALVVDLGSSRLVADRARLGVNKTALDLLLPDGSTFVADGVPWNYIACPAAGTAGMTFTLQQGSSTTYAALLVQNHRYRLQTVEYKSGTTFRPLTRTTYNSWVASNGMGAGPFTIRLTDVNGAVVEQAGIPLTIGTAFHGQAQFPLCPTP